MDNIIPLDTTPLKRCPMCPEGNQWHPATSEFFYRNKKSRDGFNTPCRRCQKDGKKHPIDVLPKGYKRCTDCKKVKPLEDFPLLDQRTLVKRPATSIQMGRRSECKICRARRNREYNKNRPRSTPRKPHSYNANSNRKHAMKKNYGMTVEEYHFLLDQQNGLYASCGKPERAKIRGKLRPLAVDHNHETGQVRGLLCSSCNSALGMLQDDPEQVRALLKYIEKHCL